ncbi:MAG: hypothetical protein MZV70_69020 [Desulfobacterales bacterium]|nr:hypothetical protein [Desulfobacterales bacterium]
MVNPDLATGEIEVLASDAARSSTRPRPPPFLIEDGDGGLGGHRASSTATSTCAGPRLQRNLILRHRRHAAIRDVPQRARASWRWRRPILTKSTPEGRPRLPGARAASTRACSTPCPSRRSSSSSS